MEKEITREEVEQMMVDISHVGSFSIPIKVSQSYRDDFGEEVTEEYKMLLNNSWVYNPFYGKQLYSGSNECNAKKAMEFVKDRLNVYSDYFQSYNGDYKIID